MCVHPANFAHIRTYICTCSVSFCVLRYIELNLPMFRLSAYAYVHTYRAKAFVQAVNCARKKAESVSLALGLQLSLPQSIVEHSCELVPSEQEPHPWPEDDEACSPSDCQPLRDRIQQNTLSFSSSVTAHFEMAQKRTCGHKSCPKHFPQ